MYEIRTLGDLGLFDRDATAEELQAAFGKGSAAARAAAAAGKLDQTPQPGNFAFENEKQRGQLVASWIDGYNTTASILRQSGSGGAPAGGGATVPGATPAGGKSSGPPPVARCDALVPLVDAGTGSVPVYVRASADTSPADAAAWGYQLHEGTTLWTIAAKFLGDGNAWRKIWEYNRAQGNNLGADPNRIRVYRADGTRTIVLLPPDANVRVACEIVARKRTGGDDGPVPGPSKGTGWILAAAAAAAALLSAKS